MAPPRPRPTSAPRRWLALALGLAACGTPSGAPSAAPAAPIAPVAPGSVREARPETRCLSRDPGPAPLRRLTRAEYNNTVRDLLGDPSAPADHFPPDDEADGFDNQASAQSVSPLLAERYVDAAEALAERATARLDALLGCVPEGAGDAPCVAGFVRRFGRRAWRRPLTDAEAADLVALYRAARAEADAREGVRAVLEALLESPKFLYRVEPPPADDAPARVEPYALASRLAYFLWGSTPDDALLDAAARGDLATADGVEREARRLLADPRARDAVGRFHMQWLELTGLRFVNKDNPPYPLYNPGVRRAMERAARAFIDWVYWESDGRLETLLTSPVAFIDADLAPLYDLPRPPADGGAGLTRVTLDPARRAGVLTLPAVLAVQARLNASSPVRRGRFVRERLLCQDLPDPPPDLVIVAPDPRPGASTRQRFAEHASNGACSPCHRLMDPIGFGLEHYDGIGRYRATDEGVAVDASGALTETRGADGPFRGAADLARRLAASDHARGCVATQWFRYALGRRETDADGCSLDAVNAAFARADFDLRELLVAIARSDAFLYRRGAPAGEPSP